jgi:uncharacterized protein (TIGR02569 family)
VSPPPPKILAAFGQTTAPAPLEGGQGSSWRVGDLVMKPLDRDEQEFVWEAAVFGSISFNGFRVAQARPALDGSLIVDGWCAHEWLEGQHEDGRWTEIIAVGELFHAALARVQRPEFIARRKDPWAVGDRVAWGELPPEKFPNVKHLTRLVNALRPVEAPSQLIHGDLTGNVLFADHLPPAIIDFAPYWRPAPFASAIVVGDALVWEDADEQLLDAVQHIRHFEQFLLRALIYRAVTDQVFRELGVPRPDDPDPYRAAVELACSLADRS